MRKIHPTPKHIAVTRISPEKSSKGGIIIPPTAEEVPLEAKVIAAGEEAAGIFAGDHILFKKYAGSTITIDGVEVVFLHVEEVLCTLGQ